MKRIVLFLAALLMAATTACTATPPPPPTANTGERLDESLIAPLGELIDTDLDIETKKALVSGDVDWDAFEYTLESETEVCTSATGDGGKYSIGVTVTDPQVVGDGARATVTVNCVTAGNSMELNFVYENIWKLSSDSFEGFAALVANAV